MGKNQATHTNLKNNLPFTIPKLAKSLHKFT